MNRILNLMLVFAVLIGAAVVFDMKYAAEQSADHVSDLRRQIDEERERIQMLTAEWSYLNQPDRLQRLVERYNAYLNLEPLSVEQITQLEDLPVKPMPLEPISSDPSLGGYAGATTKVVR